MEETGERLRKVILMIEILLIVYLVGFILLVGNEVIYHRNDNDFNWGYVIFDSLLWPLYSVLLIVILVVVPLSNLIYNIRNKEKTNGR